MKVQFNYKRLIWIIFILLYSALFFYNCLSPYHNWFFSYLYTMLLIIWLCKEYYQKHYFFQPNYFSGEAHNYLLRGFFALFFYSAFVFGLMTIVWWHKYRILNSPLLPISGILMLGLAIYNREQSARLIGSKKGIVKFYLSVGLVILSMVLGYESYFLLIYTIIIGIPLIFLQLQYYNRQLEADAK